MSDDFGSYIESVIIPACPRVEVGITVGAGFLIDSEHVATAAHVIDKRRSGEKIVCTFHRKPKPLQIEASVLRLDDDDHALLELTEKVPGSPRFLSLASLNDVRSFASGNSPREFAAYGYPVAAKGGGILVRGEVYVWDAADSSDKPVLQLHSNDVAAGMATPIHGFSGSPVIVEQKVVGHLWRIVEDPMNPGRPAYGLVYASPAEGLQTLLNGGVTGTAKQIQFSIAAQMVSQEAQIGKGMLELLLNMGRAGTSAEVTDIYSQWQNSGFPQAIGLPHAAERLIDIGEPTMALSLLESGDNSLRMRQLRALALDRAGRREESIRILSQIRPEEGDYAESRGLLAGRYKQEWLETHNKDFLIASHDVYADAYKKTLDGFPGINAAATALYLGKSEESRQIAQEVIDRLSSDADAIVEDKWQLASLGEAYLLLGDIPNARIWYKKAVESTLGAKGPVEVMRKQAQRNLKAMGLAVNALDDAFTAA